MHCSKKTPGGTEFGCVPPAQGLWRSSKLPALPESDAIRATGLGIAGAIDLTN